MTIFCRPKAQAIARQAHVLIDTEDPYDAWKTGRDGPESPEEGDGLRMTYDGTGTIPCINVCDPDGEYTYQGLSEIRAAYDALGSGLRLAEAFGEPIPVEEWRKQND